MVDRPHGRCRPTRCARSSTLFWHDHFATSLQKVKEPELMFRQNQMFRARGAGNFEALAQAVAKDPAMLVWLDANANRKGKPNENFARELFELFLLGDRQLHRGRRQGGRPGLHRLAVDRARPARSRCTAGPARRRPQDRLRPDRQLRRRGRHPHGHRPAGQRPVRHREAVERLRPAGGRRRPGRAELAAGVRQRTSTWASCCGPCSCTPSSLARPPAPGW